MQISTSYESPLVSSPSVKGMESDQQFLNLLLAQLGAQNPLEPLQDADFMNQVSQFSQMEQFQALNQNLLGLVGMQAELTGMSQLSEASALVGRRAEFADDSGTTHTGVVDRLRIEQGRIVFEMGGMEFSFDQLRSVLADEPSTGGSGTSEEAPA